MRSFYASWSRGYRKSIDQRCDWKGDLKWMGCKLSCESLLKNTIAAQNHWQKSEGSIYSLSVMNCMAHNEQAGSAKEVAGDV